MDMVEIGEKKKPFDKKDPEFVKTLEQAQQF
jgi:hypothetical protein